MKNKSIQFTALLCLMFSMLHFTACKKDEAQDDDLNDHDKPVITMTSPSDSLMYNNGDTIRINGTVTDHSLHELLVTIVDNANDSVLYSQSPEVHDFTSYTIDMKWKAQVANHTNASVIVVAEDHNSNISSDTIQVHIMP